MCSPVPRGRLLLLVFLLLLPLIAQSQRGAITRPSTLEELTHNSQTIVHGYVVGSRLEQHPQYPDLTTVVVELKVMDVMKGGSGQRMTFRQFVWDLRDKENAAGYKKGQELVLLMHAPSRLGLSSPEGMEQGRFRVEHLDKGKTRALNGTGNMFLFAGGTASKAKVSVPQAIRDNPHDLTLDQLKQLIRAYVGGQQ